METVASSHCTRLFPPRSKHTRLLSSGQKPRMWVSGRLGSCPPLTAEPTLSSAYSRPFLRRSRESMERSWIWRKTMTSLICYGNFGFTFTCFLRKKPLRFCACVLTVVFPSLICTTARVGSILPILAFFHPFANDVGFTVIKYELLTPPVVPHAAAGRLTQHSPSVIQPTSSPHVAQLPPAAVETRPCTDTLHRCRGCLCPGSSLAPSR